jgi:hypothetical protein
MSVGNLVGRQAFQAISSGLDSITAGISTTVQTGGLNSLKDSIQNFGQSTKDQIVSPRDAATKEIAQSGHAPLPGNFFSKLPAVQGGDPHVGLVSDPHINQGGDPHIPASDIADKLT